MTGRQFYNLQLYMAEVHFTGQGCTTTSCGPNHKPPFLHLQFSTVSHAVHFPLSEFAVQSEHSHHRSTVQTSTKQDCLAVAIIREICWFPGHKVTHMLSCYV